MSVASSEAQDDLLDSLLGDFLDESDQLLAQLNERMLQLDEWVQTLGGREGEACDPNLLNEMFRAAHSLKGLSAMLGLDDINNLTHKIENVFDAARNHQLTVNSDVTELVFMGLDQLVALVGRLKEPDAEPVDCSAVLDAIRRLLQGAGAERKQASQADAETSLQAAATGPVLGEAAPSDGADPFEGVHDEEGTPDNYLSIFLDETQTTLDGLTGGLLVLEAERGGESLKSLLAAAHKIKGSAAAIGMNRIAKLAHLMEDLLEEVVVCAGPAPAGLTDLLLKCTDALQRHLAALRQGGRAGDDFGPLGRELLAARARTPTGAGPGRTPYLGEVKFEPGLNTAGLKAHLIYEKLAKLGELSDCEPAPRLLADLEHLDTFRFRLGTAQPLATVQDRLRIAGVQEAHVEPVGATAPCVSPAPAAPETVAPAGAPSAAGTGGEARGADAAQRPIETVRVDIERLDNLMDLAGQLVINRARFAEIGDKLNTLLGCRQSAGALNRVALELDRMGGQIALRLDGQHSAVAQDVVRSHVERIRTQLDPLRREVQTLGEARDFVRELFEAIHQLGRVSDGIQQSVMETRMVPIGPLFARFKRVVRDITRANGKQARLVILGENTELDKRMIDELGDPLVHMVRNSVDHGIEAPEAREAAGKPREGTVTLEAFQRGNSVIIEVRDDGRGLDAERILRKCVEKGLLAQAEAAKMAPQQAYQMIWEPGLSTADRVTEVSGRGMGMDIVKSKIEELNGTVDVRSTPGEGTTMTVRLPLTLAILPSLMVEVEGDVFAIPMESVVEIVCVPRSQTGAVQGRRVANVRGRAVSLARLGELLSFRDGGGATAPGADTTLVIVSDAGKEVGVSVDRVLGEEDVVIKSIAENYQNVPGIAGASIRGDGRVSLILDIAALIETVCRKAAKTACQGVAP